MKNLLRTLALLTSLLAAGQLGATLTPGGGLYVRHTSTYVGAISPTQTLLFDLLQTYRADAEISLADAGRMRRFEEYALIWGVCPRNQLRPPPPDIKPLFCV